MRDGHIGTCSAAAHDAATTAPRTRHGTQRQLTSRCGLVDAMSRRRSSNRSTCSRCAPDRRDIVAHPPWAVVQLWHAQTPPRAAPGGDQCLQRPATRRVDGCWVACGTGRLLWVGCSRHGTRAKAAATRHARASDSRHSRGDSARRYATRPPRGVARARDPGRDNAHVGPIYFEDLSRHPFFSIFIRRSGHSAASASS